MAQPWLRLYVEILEDHRIQMLPDKLFRSLVNLWCVTKSSGVIGLDDAAFRLRMPAPKLKQIIDTLTEQGFLEEVEDGWRPHNWDGRQFKSDDSTNRVNEWRKRCKQPHRAVTCNGDATLHATPPDTDTEQRQIQSRSENVSPDLGERIERIIARHPRDRQQPSAVRIWFQNAIASSDNAEPLISAVERWQEQYLSGLESPKFARGLRKCLDDGDFLSVPQTKREPEPDFVSPYRDREVESR